MSKVIINIPQDSIVNPVLANEVIPHRYGLTIL